MIRVKQEVREMFIYLFVLILRYCVRLMKSCAGGDMASVKQRAS